MVARSVHDTTLALQAVHWRGPGPRRDHPDPERPEAGTTGSRKRGSTRAPGLCSAPGMLAILILAHPDDGKFKNWIVHKLQIAWMMQQDTATLGIQDGFWKGVNSSNLHHVFTPVDEPKSDIHLLADYTQLFGEGFQQAQRDISPYLPHWAQCTVACKTPPHETMPSSSREQQQVDAPKSSGSDVQALRQCLNPPKMTAERLQALESWLWQQLATVHGPAEPLPAWCQHWALKHHFTAKMRSCLPSGHTLHRLRIL